ncbi:MAG: 7-cyano-7-deazaguanine synthase QueC [Elusimicrobia bacterium CG1_02_37_114]|nr:MAG: 7-cyano-7-deazaguanine synthase QueC [Elusimicrobia bacterium CG1_02_37_114]PIV53155.1 MAG: 7-cyano-7-deazaguanine synthase QueC [Elusimicrobia bacterium CG02_land_8_20_14_3_00_37_13]PIZ13902.1 MAG: 7-cyano-7-deazaguanine synthase QueC [Elusimicrobia bacterium CG_4_10_14_0_8_um_filter_37_32]
MINKAVVLLSGGLDSTTTLYYAKKQKYDCYCLIFDYGQRHKKEIISAKKIAKLNSCHYYIIKFTLPWRGSSLIDGGLQIPFHKANQIGKTGVPSTYVPARNTIFISFALSLAETIGAESIFIGANAIDFSGYPDCRPEYYRQFNKLVSTAIPGKKIKIHTPLIDKTKAEIIRLGKKLNVPFELTWSCYSGGRLPCGKCDSCILRSKGFQEANS